MRTEDFGSFRSRGFAGGSWSYRKESARHETRESGIFHPVPPVDLDGTQRTSVADLAQEHADVLSC